jgi:hypothetical protein
MYIHSRARRIQISPSWNAGASIQAGLNRPCDGGFFFGVVVARDRRAGGLSIAARKIRLRRVW